MPLAFSYAQTKNRGIGLIVVVGAFRAVRHLGPRAVKAVWHAYRAGRHASWLPAEDWARNLSLPVEEVRRQLAIKPPTEYREVLATAQAAAA